MTMPTLALGPFTLWHVWLAWVTYFAWRAYYTLYLHPLSKYPGPKLAALTTWWQTYVEALSKEGLTGRLFRLHATYGDVVRIGPNELHFANPTVYNEIYHPLHRWDKDNVMYDAMTATGTHSFSTVTYLDAKKRREPIIPFFSRKNVAKGQPVIQGNLNTLCSILIDKGTAKSTNILSMYHCLTFDTISAFCFGEAMNSLHEPEFDSPNLHSMSYTIQFIPWLKHFPIVRKLIHATPPSIGKRLGPGFSGIYSTIEMLETQVHKAINNPETLDGATHDTIYKRLLDARDGNSPLTAQELVSEANLLIFAGTDTTGNTLMVGTVNVLDNQEVYKKLKAELREAWKNLEERPTYEELDKLPYLKAVIKESLRVTPAVIWPPRRVVPTGGAILGGQTIPGGTVVGCGALFVHRSEAIFPEPHKFKPERWLEPTAESLDQWLVTFHKGPRSCTGINLAWCELTMTFANIFRRFDLSFDGDVHASDLTYADCFLPNWTMKDVKVFFTPVSS